jgi:hypothetical protein
VLRSSQNINVISLVSPEAVVEPAAADDACFDDSAAGAAEDAAACGAAFPHPVNIVVTIAADNRTDKTFPFFSVSSQFYVLPVIR